MQLTATNIVKAKLINLWVVFDTIRSNDGVSRIGIHEQTGLSKQASSDLVDGLISMGLVREEKSQERRVGKPPTLLTINPEGGYSLGFHVDFEQMTAVVTDLTGKILYREDEVLTKLAPEHAVQEIEQAARRLVKATGIPRDKLLGLGLATPGPFAVEGVSPPRLPGWDGLKLSRLLEEASGIPVSLANDGQCAIIAEWRYGESARRLTDFVYMYFGIGFGTGVMIHNAIFTGAGGNPGELGHVVFVPDGAPCICGKRGCLETCVSVDAAMRYLQERGVDVSTVAGFATGFDADHPLVARWIAEGVEPLRSGINAIENLFDPQTILVGGNAPEWLIDAFLARVEPLPPSLGQHNRTLPRLMKSSLGADAVVLGAAVLPLLVMLNPQYQKSA